MLNEVLREVFTHRKNMRHVSFIVTNYYLPTLLPNFEKLTKQQIREDLIFGPLKLHKS